MPGTPAQLDQTKAKRRGGRDAARRRRGAKPVEFTITTKIVLRESDEADADSVRRLLAVLIVREMNRDGGGAS